MINLSKYRRCRGWPKKSWNEVIKYNLNFTRPTRDTTQDRSLQRSRITVAYHRQCAPNPSFGFCSSSVYLLYCCVILNIIFPCVCCNPIDQQIDLRTVSIIAPPIIDYYSFLQCRYPSNCLKVDYYQSDQQYVTSYCSRYVELLSLNCCSF